MDVTGALSTDQTPHDTEADVGKNVTLSAGGDVSVFANETLNPSKALAGQGTAAIGLSVGASVAIVNINPAVQAFVEDGTQIDAGGNVTVVAVFTDNVTAQSFAGSAGFVGSLGVQVAIVTDNAVESAWIGNTVQVTGAESLTLSADAIRTLDAEAVGGSGGLVAAGAAVADAFANGSTTATLGGQIGQAAGESVGDLGVSAVSVDSATAKSVAVAAGIGAGTGNSAQAMIDPTVAAAISAGAAVTSTVGILVAATDTPQVYANTLGVHAGAVAVGASFATATDSPIVTAAAGGSGTTITAPILEVTATSAPPAGILVRSASGNSSGTSLITGEGGKISATAAAQVDGSIGSGATVNVAGTTTVSASGTNTATALATTLSIGLALNVAASFAAPRRVARTTPTSAAGPWWGRRRSQAAASTYKPPARTSPRPFWISPEAGS